MKQKDKGELELKMKLLVEYSGRCNVQRILDKVRPNNWIISLIHVL